MRILLPVGLKRFGFLRFGVLTFALAFGLPVKAFAASLPQLDAEMFPPQIAWLIIAFVFLYILMAKVALPRIGEVLEERQNRIDDNLTKAQSLNDAAEAAKEAYEKALEDARTKAQDDLRSAQEEANREAAERHAQMREKLKALILDSEKEIAAQKAQALAGVRDVAVEVADAVVEKLIGEAPDKATVRNAVDSLGDA